MADQATERELLDEVLEGSRAMATLAENEETFRAAVDAFRAQDGESMNALLRRHELVDRCELICHWLRSKEAVLLCLWLAGPPPVEQEPPEVREFAQVVARVTADEELVEVLAQAVQERDAEAWKQLIAEQKLERFSHLLCHWVVTIHYRLVCDVVCRPVEIPRPHLIPELHSAGQAVGKFAANEEAFATAVKAVLANSCETLSSTVNDAGFGRYCYWLCEWFCSWRCLLLCFELCRTFPLEPPESEISEMLEFALAAGRLATVNGALQRLTAATLRGDVEGVGALVRELEFGRFCVQFCHWVCFLRCHFFCICVCPNPALLPWFTTVGHFDIYADIASSSGLTNKSLPYTGLSFGGGPNFAFTGCLQLGGFCPSFSPSSSSTPMMYRFLYDDGSGPVPITGGTVCSVEAGTRLINWPENVGGVAGATLVSTFQTVTIAGAPQPDPIPPAPGATWVGPSAHVIVPDSNGWVQVDPNAIGGGFQVLLGFNSPAVVAGGDPLPGVPAGTAVPSGSERAGSDLSITFQATRVTSPTPPPTSTAVDYSNALNKIHINNWAEVNLLNFTEFGTGGCCTPITDSLGVEFTVDHEEMAAGAWSLQITSCSSSAPGDITPTTTTPGVTLSARGGNGTITEDTSTWQNCSYTVTLTTRPGLTTGLIDRSPENNSLTFCICAH
jgi:hypothetical protein